MFNSESLKAFRISQGQTQQDFADAIGVTRELLSKMESGKKSISKATQILLGNYASKLGIVNKVPPTRTQLREPITGTMYEPEVSYEKPDVLHQLLTQQTAILNILAQGHVQVKTDVKEAKDVSLIALEGVKDVRVSLGNLEEIVSDSSDKLDGLLVWCAENVGPLVNRTPHQVEAEISTISAQVKKPSKTGKIVEKGKQRTSKV